MSSKIIPAQSCRWPACGQLFTPRVTRQRYCSKGCAQRHLGSLRKGQIHPAFTALAQQRKADGEARAAALCRAQFGELTARELALAEHARRRGYLQGYQAGYREIGKAS
jgi:hypothetical protein